MKKNAFTLIELVAVIVVLGVISLVVVFNVSSWLKSSKAELYEEQLQTFELAAQNWGIKNPTLLPDDTNSTVILTLLDLKNAGLVERNVKNPLTDGQFSDGLQIIITYVNGGYRYEVNRDSIY